MKLDLVKDSIDPKKLDVSEEELLKSIGIFKSNVSC